MTHYLLGRAYAKLGDMANAIAALEKGISLAGWFPVMEGVLGYVHARAGARPQAEAVLATLRRRQLTQDVSPIDLAYVCLGLGDVDGTMARLEEGYGSRAIRTVAIGDPFFSELGSDARYLDLMARLHLPIQR